MAVQFLAGQVLTAQHLQQVVPERFTQGANQAVTSSTTFVDSNLVIDIDGITELTAEIRYQASGGGFRFAWTIDGSLTELAGLHHSAGSATSTTQTTQNIADMRHSNITGMGNTLLIAQYTTSTANGLSQKFILDGVGTATFQFAQAASDASATTLNAQSYVITRKLGN